MGRNWAYSPPQSESFRCAARLSPSPLLQHEYALAIFIGQRAEAKAGGAAQVGGKRGSIDAQLQAVALLPRSRHGKGGQQHVEGRKGGIRERIGRRSGEEMLAIRLGKR